MLPWTKIVLHSIYILNYTINGEENLKCMNDGLNAIYLFYYCIIITCIIARMHVELATW